MLEISQKMLKIFQCKLYYLENVSTHTIILCTYGDVIPMETYLIGIAKLKTPFAQLGLILPYAALFLGRKP